MRLPRYVRRVEDGRAELVLHMVEAKKFTEARHAVEWANKFGELLLDFTVVRAS
jgi:hypothetical protein